MRTNSLRSYNHYLGEHMIFVLSGIFAQTMLCDDMNSEYSHNMHTPALVRYIIV